MAANGKSRATKTRLKFGLVNVPVGLVKITDEPAEAKYDVAGPSGHALHTETRFVDSEGRVVDEPQEAPEREAPEPVDPIAGPTPEEQLAAAVAPPPERKQVLVEDETGTVVERDGVRRGIFDEAGQFTDLTKQITEIDGRTKLDRMTCVKFIDVGQVPRDRVLASYYLVPDSTEAAWAVRYLYDAMRRKRRVAVVKWTKSTKQALGVVVPAARTGAIEVLQLAWANHVREPEERCLAHQQVPSNEQAVDAACALIEAMADTAANSLDELRDDREVYRSELLTMAREGREDEFELPEEPEPSEAADVTEQMFQSADRATEFAATR